MESRRSSIVPVAAFAPEATRTSTEPAPFVPNATFRKASQSPFAIQPALNPPPVSVVVWKSTPLSVSRFSASRVA